MNYLTDTDQTVLLATTVGLCSGIVANLQDLALKKWTEQDKWLDWDAAISGLVAKTAIQAIVFSAIAFVFLLYNTQNTLEEINRFIWLTGIGFGLLFTPAGRLSGWIITKIAERFTSRST